MLNKAVWLLSFLLFSEVCLGNSTSKLNQLETSIYFLNTDSNEQTSLYQLLRYNAAVQLKAEAIGTIENELPDLKKPLETTVDSVRLIDAELASRKKMYAKTVVSRYRNYKLLNNVFFLLRATSLNELFKRMSYLKMIARYQEARVQALKQDVVERNKVYRRYAEHANYWKHWQSFAELMRVEAKQDLATYKRIERQTLRSPYAVSRAIKQHNREHWLFRKEIAEHTDLELSAKDAQGLEEILPGWNWPVDTGFVLIPYGYRAIPNTNTPKLMSKGLCIQSPAGAPLNSVSNGLVTHVLDHPSFGKTILVQSDNRTVVYGYLNSVRVQPGDVVLEGQALGSSGAGSKHIGNCFFGVIVRNRFVNPIDYLMPRKLNQEG